MAKVLLFIVAMIATINSGDALKKEEILRFFGEAFVICAVAVIARYYL